MASGRLTYGESSRPIRAIWRLGNLTNTMRNIRCLDISGATNEGDVGQCFIKLREQQSKHQQRRGPGAGSRFPFQCGRFQPYISSAPNCLDMYLLVGHLPLPPSSLTVHPQGKLTTKYAISFSAPRQHYPLLLPYHLASTM
jgi:hypothetical protein